MITIRGINGDILTHFDNDVPNGNPYFEPVLTDDMESLVSSFSFSVPLELADTEHLVGLNQVLVKDRQGDLRLFVITDVHEVWTTVGGTLQVNCEDISINEMNNIIVNPFNGINFNDTLYKTFNGSGWKLKYGANWEDVDNTTMVLENYDNMRSVIASIVDTYGCQFKFMAQENQFGEITRVAEVYKSRGNDTGKYFYYDRDLLGIERDINHADIKTAIHPYYTGYDGKTYSLKGFAPANPDPDFKKDKASPLIINREASKLFDDGNSYRIMPYKTEVEGNPELVYREAIKELKKYAEPIYTYSVNVLLLQNMIGWEGEGIDLGDTVWMKERVGNRELGLEARVTAYEYHEDDPSKDVVTFSNFKEIDTTDVPELAERIFIAYANSEDGIIDFSITDSVGKAYMGVYTAAVSTQSTDPSTYSWTRIKGEDGVSAPTLNLTSSQQVMKFNSDGTPDGDQTIIFTALKQNSTETVTWEAIPYKGDITQPTITLGGTGDVRSLTSANWNNEWTRVKVTVSMGSLKDIQTVVMVSDGATGASGKAIVGYVTNESTTFAASSDGTVTDYGNGDGKFVLYEGTNKVTSGVTFARVSQVGINLLINDTTGEYKVSNMTTDMAQASVSATYKGITITKFLSFSKSKQGVKGDKGDTGNDGIAGKDGIGLKSTTVTYAASASGTTAPSTGWQEQVPTVAPDNFLWTRTVWTYTDDTSETGYSVAKMGRDGAKGNDGIAGKDGVGIAETLIEYAVSASGTTKPTSGWSTSIPTTPQGQYLWTRTTWTYTDETTEQGFTVARMGQDGARGNDGIAGKDGVGLKTTAITYAGSTSGTTPPSEGWQAQVPTVPAGQYLWTKTVWTYTDNSNETGYSVARMGQNGNNGKDGIAGKDGVGINDTLIEYAVSTSGTTKPTSGWSTSIPTVPQGQYLWTRTTWTYTDNTTEQGFTVARQGEKGDKGDQGIAGPKGADGRTQYTHIAYADNANGGGFSQSPTGKAYIGMYVDFEELDSSDPTKYAWSLIKGADGEQGVAGPKGADGRTPYFHTAYTNSTDFGAYDYSGNPNLIPVLKAKDFSPNSQIAIEDSGNSLQVTFADSEGAKFLTSSKNVPALQPNTQYTLSADVTVLEGYKGSLSSLRLAYRVAPSGTILLAATARNAQVGKKTKIYATANSSAATDPTKFDRLYFSIDTNFINPFVGTVLVENIKVERGSTATPYQPNLLDEPYYLSKAALGENIADPEKTFPINTSSYNIYQGRNTESYQLNQTYTITMKATKQATQQFAVYLAAGRIGIGTMKPVEGLSDVWQRTFKVTQDHLNGGITNILDLYQVPSTSLGAVTIDWIKLEKGDTRTPNIDYYKYLGNYTDFVQADSLNPTKYSWSLIKGADGADGQDGAPAKALTLQADSPVMKFDANDVVVSGQVITFTAVKQNFESNIAWVATPYKGNTAQPAIALKGTGDVRTLEASMWASGVTTIRVDVSADTFRDSVTISKVKDGAKGDRGSDGIAGKDGVGIRSTAITYAGSASGTTPPTTGWQTQVPTVPAGQFLWTKTVWTYTDNSTETGYSAAMMGKDGAKGNDGIAGKDGVGIKTTVIEYAVNTSGTVKPTSGWTSAVPNVPQGQYLWTRTTWTYTDNTTEQGFTVARQGANGTNGTNGTNGIDAYSAILSNEANTFAANPAGAVTDWSTGRGTFMVYKGTTRLTSGVTYAIASSVDATGTINATTGDYSVTALAKDNGSITFKATIGSTVLTKTMSLSKARQGVQGVQGTMGIAYYRPTEPTGSTVTDGATWFKTTSTADDTVVGIYTRKNGAWKETPLASGALSVSELSAITATLGDVTAGSMTGVDITGATFINPFDFVMPDGNHLQGTTTIKDATVTIQGTANVGTDGERKFKTSVDPLYVQGVYSDSSDNVLSTWNMSQSGMFVNDAKTRVTTTVSGDGLQVIDAKNQKIVTASGTNGVGIIDNVTKKRTLIQSNGIQVNDRPPTKMYFSMGEELAGQVIKNMRLRVGTSNGYPYIGWGMDKSDSLIKVVQPYLLQVTRDCSLYITVSLRMQGVDSPWIYGNVNVATNASDTNGTGTFTDYQFFGESGITTKSGRIVSTGGVLVPVKANQYMAFAMDAPNDKRVDFIRIMSVGIEEVYVPDVAVL